MSWTLQLYRDDVLIDTVNAATPAGLTPTVDPAVDGTYHAVVTRNSSGLFQQSNDIDVVLSTPPSGSPTNLQLPAITGLTSLNAPLVFDVGLWTLADSFEIEIIQSNPSAVLLTRQSVTGSTVGNITPVEGSTLTLRVWATNSEGTILAESSEFGPIGPEGDTWIGGWVISSTLAHNPTPSGSPYEYNLLAVNPANNPYDSGTGWGWTGTILTGTFSGIDKSDPRLKGRFGNNVAGGQAGFRIDLPEPGVYLFYAGLGALSTVTPSLLIRDGVDQNAPILHQINGDRSISTTSAQTMDAAGNVRDSALWASESLYGGTPIELTVTGTSIFLSRLETSGASQVNNWTILKKVST